MIRVKGMKIRLADPRKLGLGAQQVIAGFLRKTYERCRASAMSGDLPDGSEIPALKPGYAAYRANYRAKYGIGGGGDHENLSGHMWARHNAAIRVGIKKKMIVGFVKFRGAKVFKNTKGVNAPRRKQGRIAQPARAKARQLGRKYGQPILAIRDDELAAFAKVFLKKYCDGINNATYHFSKSFGNPS